MYVCMYVCIYVCMYVFIYLFLNRGYAKRKHELLGEPMSLDHNSSVST